MIVRTPDLWTLVRKRPQIDPSDLAQALRAEMRHEPSDYRSRLLIRDSLDALRSYWGEKRFSEWLSACPEKDGFGSVVAERFTEVGYPSLKERLMDKTDPTEIRQFLLELGRSLREAVRIEVAGVLPMIFGGYVQRHTEDIDIVGDVPPQIRNNHKLLEELQKSYGLEVGHVQSHYFPSGWESRISSLGVFGGLTVYLLDVYDVFLSKLFSARRKDIDDLRVSAPQLDKETIVRRLKENAGGLLAAPRLKELAKDNWQLLFGEDLPS